MKISTDYKIKIFNKEKKNKEKRNAFFILLALACFYAYFFPIFGLFILIICFIFYKKSKKININNRELATVIWIVISFTCLFYYHRSVRDSFCNVIKCFFDKTVLFVIALSAI